MKAARLAARRRFPARAACQGDDESQATTARLHSASRSPAPVATEVARQLIDTGKVDVAYLGIEPAQVTPELASDLDLPAPAGVLVAAVVEAGPAANAEVKKGDVIVQLDDRKLVLVEDLFAELRDHKPGDKVTLTVVRGGDRKQIDVTLGEAGS